MHVQLSSRVPRLSRYGLVYGKLGIVIRAPDKTSARESGDEASQFICPILKLNNNKRDPLYVMIKKSLISEFSCIFRMHPLCLFLALTLIYIKVRNSLFSGIFSKWLVLLYDIASLINIT